MTDYVNMIWQAIQEQARTALAALEAHSRYYMVVYPEQVITRIRDSALEDAQVPRALRDLLYDIARPPAHEKDADLCPWQTSEALHALQVLAISPTPDEALAAVGPAPDMVFLEAWADDLRILPKAIRRGGRRKDPDDVLRELYHEEQRETRQALIRYLSRPLGDLADALPNDERKRFEDVLNASMRWRKMNTGVARNGGPGRREMKAGTGPEGHRWRPRAPGTSSRPTASGSNGSWPPMRAGAQHQGRTAVCRRPARPSATPWPNSLRSSGGRPAPAAGCIKAPRHAELAIGRGGAITLVGKRSTADRTNRK
jgi:hypothetical protein